MNILILFTWALFPCTFAFPIHPISNAVGGLSKLFVPEGSTFDGASIKKVRTLLQMPPVSDHPNTIDVILPKDDHRWDTNEELYCRIYEKGDGRDEELIFWIHGGGFTIGNIYNDDSIATRLQQHTNLTVISLSYGLAPENPYPQGLNDIVEAIELIIGSYERHVPRITL